MSPLDAILRPRSVAVIGASQKRGTLSGEVFHNLLACGFQGPVYPVNPSRAVVQSVRAYRSIADVPEVVDLAVLIVPADRVNEAARACGERGVRGLVVISAGFGETGPEGKAREAELKAIVDRFGMRMVGPNCLGVLNAEPDVALNATFSPTFPPFGNVGFSSQSGALGLAILEHARELGLGFSSFVSMGNKTDVSGNDLLAHWEDDPATELVLLYLESLGNPSRFMELARRVSRKKPIVVVKSGRTEAGARAASSHTGSLAGMDVAVDALLGQAGVLRTDTMDQLFDVAMLLASQPVPKGRRVAVLTNAGGPGIMATDACASRGLDVVRLSEQTQAALAGFLPEEASVKNPVDMIASATAASYEKALSVLLRSGEVDAVLVVFVTPIVTEAEDVAHAILSAQGDTDKTVVTCFMGKRGVRAAVSSLRARKVPSYAFPEAAAAALALAARHGEWLALPEGTVPTFDDVDDDAVRALGPAQGASPRWLDPDEVRRLLVAYRLGVPRETVVKDEEEAVRRAGEVGFPMAVKLVSSTITHKSDVGGVVLSVRDEASLRAAVRGIRERLAALSREGELDGFLLQRMHRGVELFVGMTRDPAFGPLVGFGLGGVEVELWKDVVFRVAPLRDVDAGEMQGQIRGRARLEGFRGGPKVSRDEVAEVLLRVSQLVLRHPFVLELDLNPILAGDGPLTVADARVRVG